MPPRSPSTPGPVWAGPSADGPRGGVSVSLLQKCLSCRERFRAFAIEGWRAAPRFDHKIFFGQAWHAAEESFAAEGDPYTAVDAAAQFGAEQGNVYPASREDITKWVNVLAVTFPEYVRYWAHRPESDVHDPLLQEHAFDVPYTLPSGRTVRLRGRWDGVTRRRSDGTVWLFETKTKGDVDELELTRQLTFDLQTMTYAAAVTRAAELGLYGLSPGDTVGGVRYNVVRRPLSGGKGTIVRHKPTKSNPVGESEADYYNRLAEYIKAEPHTYFFRWTVEVSDADLYVFRTKFLDPCLEFLCAWYEAVRPDAYTDVFKLDPSALTWRTPYGLTGQIADGYGSDLDRYLDTGSTVGLARVNTVFPEL